MLLNIPIAKVLFPGFVDMPYKTLVCLLFSAIAMLLLNKEKVGKWDNIIASVLSFTVLLIALITLGHYMLDGRKEMADYLTQQTEIGGAKFSGMPAITASLLFLLSVVLLLLRSRKLVFLIHAILIAGIVFLLLVFLISVSGIKADNNFSAINTTLFEASFLFLALYSAVFFSYPLSHLHFSFQKKIAAVFVLVSLLLGIIFFAFNKNNQRSLVKAKLVDHTNEVILQAERIRTEAFEMQNAVRAFFVTGDSIYLPLFFSAAMVIRNNIHQLQSLTEEDNIQQNRTDTLGSIISNFITARIDLIALRKAEKFDDKKIKLTLKEGNETIALAKALIIAIQQEEDITLAKRKAEYEQSLQSSYRVIILLQVITGLLMAGAIAVIYNNTRARNKAATEIKNLNATLERRVEEKTRVAVEKDQRYLFLLQNMREGILIIGHNWKYLFVNNSAVLQTNHPAEELLGHTIMESHPGLEKMELFKVLQRCMAERLPEVFDFEYTFADGNKLWSELSIQPVQEGLFVLSMEITERKKIEEALIASEELSRLIITSALDAIICIDIQSQITVWNPKAEKIFGWKEQDVLGQNLADTIIPAQYRESHRKGLEKYLATGEGPLLNKLIEITAVNSHGIQFPVEMSIVPFEQKGKLFFCGFIRDITERRKAAENLENYAAELQASNSELERFAYVASHDLQEPLRMASSFMSLLENRLEGQLDETTKQYIHFAVDGAERMKTLIQAMLQYSRVGNQKEDFISIDLNEVMAYVTQLLAEEIHHSRATVSFNNLPAITGNKILISQLFTNLVSNSLKYHGAKEPVIKVGSIAKPSEWLMYVKDNGIGIDTKYFEKIFIIFQRLHNNTEYSGTGIGLAICKKIVDIHKGKIWLESEAGAGSTFYFSIPKYIL
ncbi:MAG: PAS domain S-box protein [Ferruginibacter sp.]